VIQPVRTSTANRQGRKKVGTFILARRMCKNAVNATETSVLKNQEQDRMSYAYTDHAWILPRGRLQTVFYGLKSTWLWKI